MRELYLLEDPGPDEAWQLAALCATVDPGTFFDNKRADEALAICGRCPVRQECYDFGEANDEPFGVWGGVDRSARWRRA